MLKSFYTANLTEAGIDETGRGCLAGPVFAAAVIFPPGYKNPLINDSKKLSNKSRLVLRDVIMKDALDWSVEKVDNLTIDEVNILNASFLAMHMAVKNLKTLPELLLIDGNRFTPYYNVKHHCIVKGDQKYLSIAAASILAKTTRDTYMLELHKKYPNYGWDKNKGYPTRQHRESITRYGVTPYHRKSFNLNEQIKIDF